MSVASDSRRVKIIIPDVPEETREAVDREAFERDTSRNEVAIEILCEHLGVKQPPKTVARSRPLDTTREGPWSLEVPQYVRAALRIAAARKGATIQGIVRYALAEKFELPTEEPTRRPRGSR
jgi:hypothetical protein